MLPPAGDPATWGTETSSLKLSHEKESRTSAVGGLCDCVTVEICMSRQLNIWVGCVSRAPSSDIVPVRDPVEEFLTPTQQKVALVCGDFNINLLWSPRLDATEVVFPSCPVRTNYVFAIFHCGGGGGGGGWRWPRRAVSSALGGAAAPRGREDAANVLLDVQTSHWGLIPINLRASWTSAGLGGELWTSPPRPLPPLESLHRLVVVGS